jgi:mono/diheme cytochrome c family protein
MDRGDLAGRPTRRVLLTGVLLVLLGGCVRGCPSKRPPIHLNPNMDVQPKYLPQSESAFFADGATMRLPVEGTVAREDLPRDPVLETGLDADGAFLDHNALEVTPEVLARGAERYGIYCTPCHGPAGDGLGPVSVRGKLPSADLHQERIRQLADGELFDVITHGKGLMPGYAFPIPPRDRWAIITHVRQLQAEATP